MKHENSNRIAFIHLLRGIAPLLVLWAHLGGWWLAVDGRTSPIQTGWINLICRPFRLYQDGGHLGVLLFFLVSGFIITYVSIRESHFEFFIKRVCRLLPTLVVAVGILPVLKWASASLGYPPPMGSQSDSYLSGLLLLNYFSGSPQVLTVLWTLFIEVWFYALTFMLLGLSKHHPVRATWMMLAVPVLLNVAAIVFPALHPLMWGVMYIPFLLIGRCIFLARSNPEHATQASIAGFASYGSFLLIYEFISPGRLFLPGCEPILSHLYAIVIFLALAMSHIQKAPIVLGIAADVSYSLYLLHAPLGCFILFLLTRNNLSYEAALPFTVVLVIGASYIVHRYIERPAHGIGQRICSRFHNIRHKSSV